VLAAQTHAAQQLGYMHMWLRDVVGASGKHAVLRAQIADCSFAKSCWPALLIACLMQIMQILMMLVDHAAYIVCMPHQYC
jgi:hypothetical protein